MPASALAQAVACLARDFAVTPLVACETEFYLFGANALESIEPFWQRLRAGARERGVAVHKTEQERGPEQFEVALAPAPAEEAARQAAELTLLIAESAGVLNLQASFAAKPLAEHPGSGLHVHLHLENAAGENLFWKREAEISEYLRHSLGGLLATLPECMPVFAPHAESYARFAPGSNAPTTVSWGANNRTVALRLPDKPSQHKHIEHRVAGADADHAAVITAILAGVHYGLAEKLSPAAQIYGDASLPIYALPALPRSLDAALQAAENGVLRRR